MPPPPGNVYWANETGLDLAETVWKRVRYWYEKLPTTLVYMRWTKGWRAYAGLPDSGNPFDVSILAFSGQESEHANVRVNHIGALGRNAVQVVTQNRMEFQPVATNSDEASDAETSVSKGILEYEMGELKLEEKRAYLNEIAVACGEAYAGITWNPSWGKVYVTDPATGTKLHEGRAEAAVYMPWNVIVDLRREDAEHQWHITVDRANKWDYAAKFPELAADIIALTDKRREWLPGAEVDSAQKDNTIEDDFVPVFTLYHAQTDACPEGRWAVVLSDNILLAEGPLPYERTPVYRHSAGRLLGTGHGDSPLQHGLGVQDLVDKLISAVASNNINHSHQNVVAPKGAAFSRTEIAEGQSWFEVELDAHGQMPMPQAIQLVRSSPETYSLINTLVQSLAVITGINGVVSGQDPGLQGKLSGAAMVLLEAQTLRFLSGLQSSDVRFIEFSGTALVQIFKRYARSPRLARIAGIAKEFEMKQFTGESFAAFDRVQVQEGNAGMRTLAYRTQMAQDLAQLPNSNITPKQYMQVVSTGDLESETEGNETQLLNARKENEQLRQGGAPLVMVTDDPVLHIKLPLSLLDDPDVRADPKVVQAVLAHVQAHLAEWRQADPALMQLMGYPPPPPPPLPPGMPPPGAPGPGGPPGAPPGPPGPPGQQPIVQGGHPPPRHGGAPMARLTAPPAGPQPPGPPQMPRNLSTGQRPPLPAGSSGRP